MSSTLSYTSFGQVSQGQTLGAFAQDAVPDLLLSYQWQASADGLTWSNIALANQRNYTLQQSDVGQKIRVLATVASDASLGVANVNDQPTGAVTVVGAATEDARLTASASIQDLDGLGPLTYQWQASADGTTWANISGANQAAIDLTVAQVGQQVRAVVSYTDGKGTSEQVVSTPTQVVTHVNHLPTGAVSLTGPTTSEGTLSATSTLADKDGIGTIAYSWQASSDGTNWTTIEGANAQTLALNGLAGKSVRVVATYQDAGGTTEVANSVASAKVNDLATGEVTITGTVTQGQTLSADAQVADLNGLGTLSWKWQQQAAGSQVWQDVVGQTTSSLVIEQDSVGKALRAVASFTDGAGSREFVTSAGTTAVANTDDATQGNLAVSGTFKDGQNVSASTVGITDADGLGTFTYQWQYQDAEQAWVNIAGGDKQSIKLDQPLVGKQVRLVAEHTDLGGYKATLTSVATAVTNANDAPVGTLVTSGNQVVGNALTVSAANVQDLDGLGQFNYQWQSLSQGGAWANIDGQTAAQLSISSHLAAQKVRALVSYTDGFGAQEQLIGSASGPIKAANWVDSDAAGSVSVAGKYAVGQTLTASNTLTDADWLSNVAYQWQISSNGASGWKNITGATQAQLTLGSTVQGKYVRAVATTTDELGGHDQVIGDVSTKIAKANIAPKFAKATLAVKVNEGMLAVMTPAASDVGDTVSYAISGEDAGLFEIKSGNIFFKAAADYEKPKDANSDNAYKFTLTATDSYGAISYQAVTVSVANVNERPELLQHTRTVMVKSGTRYLADFMSNQVVDPDTDPRMNISNKFSISGDDAALFSTNFGRLYLAKNMVLGSYHIDIVAKDKLGVQSDLQAVTIEVVDQIQTTATTGHDNLIGTIGVDVMDGGLGNDKLIGGFGLDTFRVNAGKDVIYDLGYGGQEILQIGQSAEVVADVTSDWKATAATVNNGLATLNSTGADIDLSAVQAGQGFTLVGVSGQGQLTGSGLNDVLWASAEGSVLRGAGGNDNLHGGAGADQFVLEGLGLDTLLDFQSGKDVIALANLGLPTGALGAEAFAKGAGLNEATTAAQRVLYDTTAGKLWFDADGVGVQQAVLLAELPQLLEIKNTDFLLI